MIYIGLGHKVNSISIHISFCIAFIRALAFFRWLSRAADLYRVLVSFERFALRSVRQSDSQASLVILFAQ
jgi:hypothetical protein